MQNISFIEIKYSDLQIVKKIYDHYILNSTATFYTEPVTEDELSQFIPVDHEKYKSYLVKKDEEIIGFCYFGQYKKRQAYDRTAEISLYLKHGFTGKGLGKIILAWLEKVALDKGIAVLIGIISGDNENSIRLFEKCGYEKCGHLKQVGEKFGKILDVVYYQKTEASNNQ